MHCTGYQLVIPIEIQQQVLLWLPLRLPMSLERLDRRLFEMPQLDLVIPLYCQ